MAKNLWKQISNIIISNYWNNSTLKLIKMGLTIKPITWSELEEFPVLWLLKQRNPTQLVPTQWKSKMKCSYSWFELSFYIELFSSKYSSFYATYKYRFRKLLLKLNKIISITIGLSMCITWCLDKYNFQIPDPIHYNIMRFSVAWKFSLVKPKQNKNRHFSLHLNINFFCP